MIQDRFRTPDGRECVAINYDTTRFSSPNSLDAFHQMDHYSGGRDKGHCVLGGALTCAAGTAVAVTPGFKISATPRGGDGIAMGVELGIADEAIERSGFTRLLRGTPNIGVLLVFDRGFVYIPRNVNTGTNPTPVEWCRQNNVQTLWRFKTGEKAFRYDRSQDVLEEVHHNDDETLAANRENCNEHFKFQISVLIQILHLEHHI